MRILSLLLAVILLFAPVSQRKALAEVPAQEAADFSDLVFDTENDPFTLTVRYLYMDKMLLAGEDFVYSGDCSVYISPDGCVMLVDTSNKISAPDVIAQLKRMGVEKIDYVVFSHPHADHVGGFCDIAEVFPIAQVYTNGHDYESTTYQNCITKMKELDIPCAALVAGDSFRLGSQVLVTVFGPQPSQNDQVAAGFQDANDGSLALRVTYGESSFWTSGDLYISGEEALVARYGEQICSDIIKLNHHGKDTSNGRAFAKNMNCLMAVGMNDNVGSVTVARRFLVSGAQVFYNACDGAIRVRTTGDGTYQVQTQFLRNLSILPQPSEDGSYTISRP